MAGETAPTGGRTTPGGSGPPGPPGPGNPPTLLTKTGFAGVAPREPLIRSATPPAMLVTRPPVNLFTANAPTARFWISGGRDWKRPTAALTIVRVASALFWRIGAAALAVSKNDESAFVA